MSIYDLTEKDLEDLIDDTECNLDLTKEGYHDSLCATEAIVERMEEIYGERFREIVSLQSLSSLQGKIDGNYFWLSPYIHKDNKNDFYGHICAMNVSAGSSEQIDVLEQLKPFISKIMGNATPICCYDMVTSISIQIKKEDYEEADFNEDEYIEKKNRREKYKLGKRISETENNGIKTVTFKCICPTIEWNIINPEQRIQDIIDDMNTNEQSKFKNLQLLNGKNISDYLTNNEKKINKRTRNIK